MSAPTTVLEGSYEIGEVLPEHGAVRREGDPRPVLPRRFPGDGPTTLGPVGSDDLTLGPASYPVGEAQRFDWTPVVLDLYRGRIEIDVPVQVETGANPGRRTVSGRVRYQGCTANACLPPAELGVEVDLEVMGKEEGRT